MGSRRADFAIAWRALVVIVTAFALTACGEGGEQAADETAPGNDDAPLHPGFTLDAAAVDELVAATEAEVQAAVAAAPGRFLDLLEKVLDEPADRTVLVDKTNALGEDYVPDDLVELDTVDGLTLSRDGHRLTSDTVEALLPMSGAAADEGITLVVSSTYRSYDYQAALFARWVEELGQEEAERVSARPGTSQHQLGTTVDFGCICDAFADEPAGRWLAANAWRFGFSLSYPEGREETTGYAYEPWHFRYVGRPAALLERDYFAGVQQWMLEFLHAHRRELETARSGADPV